MAPRKKPLPLTMKELKVLEFIEQFMLDQGVAPSYQEIRENFGFASFNSVQRYLKQLQDKNYIYIPGGNQKRALQVLHSSKSISNLLTDRIGDSAAIVPTTQNKFPSQTLKDSRRDEMSPPPAGNPLFAGETVSLPLLGRVAAGLPIEAFTHNEFMNVPATLVRNPSKTFALVVQGQSMVEDGILDGDVIFVQKQSYANNGETIVAMVNNQATVKRFYLHRRRNSDVHMNPQSHTHPPGSEQPNRLRTTHEEQSVELRPANSTMESMWYSPSTVDIQGIVVGLIRRF